MFRISIILILSTLTTIANADTVVIGNASPLTDWNRSLAAVRVFDLAFSPPFRTLAQNESSGPMANVVGVASASDGLLSASSYVDAYHLSGGVTTIGAPEGVHVTSQIRDQIFVDADFDENSVLEFEFSLNYAAGVADPGFADFQFTLFALKPDGSFLFLDDVSSVDFGLGDGPYDIDTSRTLNVSTAMSGVDDVLITSETYVPLQFSLTGTAGGTANLDYLNSLELTGFNVVDSNGTPLGAFTSSSQDPANSLLNTNPVPEPGGFIVLVGMLGLTFRRPRK